MTIITYQRYVRDFPEEFTTWFLIKNRWTTNT